MPDDYTVIWDGRGSMPHQTINAQYHQVTRSLFERMAPNKGDFITQKEANAATKRLGLAGKSWKTLDGNTISPRASKRAKATP